jgi:site-specific recombinase XerD
MQALTVPQTGQATVYKRLIMGKLSERTRAAYAQDLRDFAQFLGIEALGGEHPLANVSDAAWTDLDTAHVAAYLEHLKRAISTKTGRPYSTSTIARRMTAVREFLTEARFQGVFSQAKLDYIRERLTTQEVTHQHHAGISPDDQAKLLKTTNAQGGLKALRDYTLMRLWLDTGLRRAEIAALKVRDLIVKAGIPTLIVHGKRGWVREIGLESYTDWVIRDWLEKSGQDADPDRPIFCQVRKAGRGADAKYRVVDPERHLSGTALWKLVLWYCHKACIKSKVTPHSFRVAFVTDHLDGGAPIQHVQRAGGWTTTRMIAEVYDRNVYNEPVSRYRKTSLPKHEVPGQS